MSDAVIAFGGLAVIVMAEWAVFRLWLRWWPQRGVDEKGHSGG